MEEAYLVTIVMAGGLVVEVPPEQELQALELNQRWGQVPLHRLVFGEAGVGRYSLEWGACLRLTWQGAGCKGECGTPGVELYRKEGGVSVGRFPYEGGTPPPTSEPGVFSPGGPPRRRNWPGNCIAGDRGAGDRPGLESNPNQERILSYRGAKENRPMPA